MPIFKLTFSDGKHKYIECDTVEPYTDKHNVTVLIIDLIDQYWDPSISMRFYNFCRDKNITTAMELSQLTRFDIISSPRCGARTADYAQELLLSVGLSLTK
jgi:hypothetical protein